jgi:signal transduction histidine kinase/AraC-like DNA-binding protein/ABC-type sugar transport system substrate-binding protein/DNA-binding LytR/AlgR family response regulator
MRQKVRVRPTVGFLSTWSVYEGTAIDSYSHSLLQGICAAARECDCNLLLGCGISLPGSPRASRTAWAVPGAGVDFVPVGPWNTDGLVVIPDDLSDVQFEYVQDLIRSGYPVVLTTAEKPGSLVAVDNAGGIRQAFDHLWQHGHRRIAFIAGKSGRGGDSAERLSAYREALRDAGVDEDARLIAFGEHRRKDGRTAMQQILATGAPFTAVLASNDLSGLGAMEVLRAAGRRVPNDVAVIGFDDILEARSHFPPLTTVRHPTFTLGYQAVLSLLDAIAGMRIGEMHTRIPTQLVIRQSCGCRPESTESIPVTTLVPSAQSDLETTQTTLSRAMAEATLVEARHSTRQEIETLCLDLARAFTSSLGDNDPALFDVALQQLFDWLEGRGEDTYAWHAALSTLRRGLSDLLPLVPGANLVFADSLIDQSRLAIAEQVQRQATDALLRHMEMANRLGLMTSQLLAAFDASESADILAHHLLQLGLQHALVALYVPREDDPLSQCTVLLDTGLPESAVSRQIPVWEFPPPGLYPPDSGFQLAILPLVIDDRTTGFAAFSATNLEPCAAIVHNLASALRTSRLYRDALEGRRLAEEANRLKSRFLSVVSHELRTPLSLIVGLSDMILREQRGKSQLSDVMLHDMERIYASAQHLGQLIGDVLDLASSEAGQLRLLREPLDLSEVLRAAAQIGEQMANERGLTWRASLPQHGPWVLGDRTRLHQVVLNLIGNAVKFTTSGMVVLQVETNEQQATVLVSDTGIGIPPTEQESIFREFHRSERTIQSGYGGLGLGLAICKYLVEQHGGTIGVRSPGDPGSGSTFFFTLPIVPAPGTVPDQDLLPIPHTGCVAVLSKHVETGDRLSVFLRERGFDVQVYRVDQETDWLIHLLAVLPAALVLDQETATHHGWALLERLRRQPSTEHIPVLVYSLDLEHDRGEWLELNYLPKPLASEQLVEQLARYVDSTERVVLVVDDDPGILDLHCRLVEQAGCRAVCARNGRAALEVLEYTQPDLILLDLMMPELNGFAVLDALRAREMTRDIPVIVLTARVLDETDIGRLNRGVAAIMSKGLFNTTETLTRIEAALARHQALGGPTQRLIRRAMGFIHAHYAEPLTREQIASHVHFSPDYLTDCFRQEQGVTPMVYLNRYRICQARKLLENSDLTITQVALAVGFSESAHFTRTFQREVGMTPRAYRRSKRG